MKLRQRTKKPIECRIIKLPDGWRLTENVADGFYLTLYILKEQPRVEDGKLIINIHLEEQNDPLLLLNRETNISTKGLFKLEKA